MAAVNLIKTTKVYCSLFFDRHIPCLLCGQHQSQILCADCLPLLPTNHPSLCRCGLPHAPGSEPAPLCGRCLKDPPPFAASRAPLCYQFPLDALIQRYKYRGDLVSETGLEQLVASCPNPWPQADALCPLPAHWQRRWLRGFDQSERLARRLSRQWQQPLLNALQRGRATPRQQGLSRKQRQRNLQGAFSCTADVQGLHLTLIDDVMTTGSSARAAARCLLEHGARQVTVWTLARTPQP